MGNQFKSAAAFSDIVTTDTSLVCTYAVAPGDCVVVSVSNQAANITATGVTDNGGNNYPLRNSTGTAASNTQTYVSIATASASTITASFGSGTNHTVTIATYAGVASLGNSYFASGTGTAPTIAAVLNSPDNWAVGTLATGSSGINNVIGNVRCYNQATGSLRAYILDITGSTSPSLGGTLAGGTSWNINYVELIPISAPVGIRAKTSAQFFQTGTVTTATFAFPVAVGDCVVVFVSTQANASNAPTITDDGGNTYTPGPTLANTAGNGPNIYSFTTFATAAATQITSTMGLSAGSLGVLVQSYQKVASLGTNSGTQTTGAATSTVATITGTLAATNNRMVAELVFRGSVQTAFTTTAGNLRAWYSIMAPPSALTSNQNPAIVDNTGALSLTCALTSNTAQINSGVYLELVPFAPVLTSISPSTGTQGNTVPITLTGTNLTGTAAISVTGGGVSVTNLVVVNDTTVTANFVIASGATPGAVSVSLATPVGPSNSLTFTIQSAAVAPSLSSISPASGTQGATVPVTITGTNLTGATAVNVTGGGVTVTNLTVVNSTTITASFVIAANASVANQSVTVVTPSGTSNPVSFEIQNAVSPGANLLAVAATLTLINN